MKSYCIYIGSTIIIGVGVVYIVRNHKPNVNLLYNLLHYGIYYYSKTQRLSHKYINQLYQNKYVKKTINYIENKKYIIKEYLWNDVEIIKYNNMIFSCKLNNLILYNPLYMDFFICSDIHSFPVNKLVGKDIYGFMKKFVMCDFKFYSITLILSERERYPISLSSNHYNYYIVGNVIDKYVFFYLLNRQHGININVDRDLCYTLEMLDNNMDLVFVTEKDEIVLSETNYKIKNVFSIRDEQIRFHQDYVKISDTLFKERESYDHSSKDTLDGSFVEIE